MLFSLLSYFASGAALLSVLVLIVVAKNP